MGPCEPLCLPQTALLADVTETGVDLHCLLHHQIRTDERCWFVLPLGTSPVYYNTPFLPRGISQPVIMKLPLAYHERIPSEVTAGPACHLYRKPKYSTYDETDPAE
jgi:hypothetical protein